MRLTKTSVLAAALFFSLIANFWLAGNMIGKQAGQRDAFPKAEKGLYKIAKDLSAEQRKEIGSIIASKQEALTQKREEIRQQRDRIRSLLQGKKMDERQLKEAFARHRELLDGLQQILQDQTIEIAMVLPRKERMKMADPQRSHPASSGKHTKGKNGKAEKKDGASPAKQ